MYDISFSPDEDEMEERRLNLTEGNKRSTLKLNMDFVEGAKLKLQQQKKIIVSVKSDELDKFNSNKDKQNLIPAVTHIDGTGRVQTVTRDINRNFYNLIEKFYQLSNVPILLNTSFNENEPIVNKPEDALECFLRTKMDMLVMENIIIER